MLGWVFWLGFFVGCCGFGQQEELIASSKTCKNEFIFGKKDPGIFSIWLLLWNIPSGPQEYL